MLQSSRSVGHARHGWLQCGPRREVDWLMHPLKSELNFPLGDLEPVDLLPERYELVQWLMQALAGPGGPPELRQGGTGPLLLRAIRCVIRSR